MSKLPLSICNEPGCNHLSRGRYCAKHMRSSSGTRSVLGQSHAWQKARRIYRDGNPFCVTCLFEDRSVPAECVDHIIPHCDRDQLFWDEHNWQSLCWVHHNQKSQLERKLGMWTPKEYLMVVCGLPGVGKTTYAQCLAAAWDCDYYDADEAADQLGIPRHNQTEQQVQAIRTHRSQWLRGRAQAIVILSRPSSALQLAAAMQARVRHLVCRESERLQRINERNLIEK